MFLTGYYDHNLTIHIDPTEKTFHSACLRDTKCFLRIQGNNFSIQEVELTSFLIQHWNSCENLNKLLMTVGIVSSISQEEIMQIQQERVTGEMLQWIKHELLQGCKGITTAQTSINQENRKIEIKIGCLSGTNNKNKIRHTFRNIHMTSEDHKLFEPSNLKYEVHSKENVALPKLKISTEDFLICVSKKLSEQLESKIEPNSKYAEPKDFGPNGKSKISKVGESNLSIFDYVMRIHRYKFYPLYDMEKIAKKKITKEKIAFWVYAYVLLSRYLNKKNIELNKLNIHRLIAISVRITDKMIMDDHYNNWYASKVFGISLPECNNLELTFLSEIEFSCHISRKEHNKTRKMFIEAIMKPSLPMGKGDFSKLGGDGNPSANHRGKREVLDADKECCGDITSLSQEFSQKLELSHTPAILHSPNSPKSPQLSNLKKCESPDLESDDRLSSIYHLKRPMKR